MKSDAEKWARDLERRIDRGDSVRRKGPDKFRTFGDLVDQHIEDMLEAGKPLRRPKSYSLQLLKDRLGPRPFFAQIEKYRCVAYAYRKRMSECADHVLIIASTTSSLDEIIEHGPHFKFPGYGLHMYQVV